MASLITGVILANQSFKVNPAYASGFFNYTNKGLNDAGSQVMENGLISTVNYYIALASKKEYVGFENSLVSPDAEIDNSNNANSNESSGDEAFIIINNSSLVASANFAADNSGTSSASQSEPRKDVIVYQVASGDTPSAIAESFGISTNTLLWANNLDLNSATKIQPGDKLVILPISGIRHVIKTGETAASITKKYAANMDQVLAYNSLKADSKLEVNSILIIPDGKMPAPPATAKPKVTLAYVNKNANNPKATGVYRYVTSDQYNSVNTEAGDDHPPVHGRLFPWGQCTYYVALRRYVPWNGNAKNWLTNARAYGYKTGSTPTVGSIVVTAENPRYGHVAYVEAVNGDKITVSEMNFVGLGIKSSRVISTNNKVIRGYIYDK